MPIEVVIPEVGETGMEVTFLRWLKDEGEHVSEGEPLFEVDTEKSTLAIEAYASGRLAGRRVSDGDQVRPHQVVAVLLQPGESLPDAVPADHEGGAGAVGGSPRAQNDREGGAGAAGGSPRARARARELGVDLSAVSGTGPGGLVTADDVERAAQQPRAPTRQDRTRRAIAATTTRNWQTIPHIQLSVEVDVTAALEVAKPTVAVLVALCRALEAQPECNLGWVGEELTRRERIDLGLLVDTPGGLLLPVIRDAGRLDLGGLAAAAHDAAERARAGALRSEDTGPRSATVSNLGMFAVDSFDGVIAAPDVLLLTVGRVRRVPRWRDGILAARKVAALTLAIDHRALDGADGGRLLNRLEAALTDPEVLRGQH